MGVADFDETFNNCLYCNGDYICQVTSILAKKKIFPPKFTLGYMGGGRWTWPILMKLLIFLNLVIKRLCAKFF